MTAAVCRLSGLEVFSSPPFVQKKVTDDSPPPSTDNASTKISYISATKASAPAGSVAEEVALAMGVPKIIVDLVKASQRLEQGTSIKNASEFYAAAENLIKHPEEQARMAKLIEAEQVQKEVESRDLVSRKVKEASTESRPLEDEAQLKEKVKQLAEENHKLSKRKMCRACRKVDLASSGITFLPCGHFITCETCSERFDDCPACGKSIMGTVRTFLS
ncbi:hypothetical protein ACOMHN_020684 [Nucella lapillus]